MIKFVLMPDYFAILRIPHGAMIKKKQKKIINTFLFILSKNGLEWKKVIYYRLLYGSHDLHVSVRFISLTSKGQKLRLSMTAKPAGKNINDLLHTSACVVCVSDSL